MPATLYLIQHFHDLSLHEGRNIGVAVVGEDSRVHLRLGGIASDGSYDRGWLRRFNLTRSYYDAWRGFLESSARSGNWEDVLSFQSQKPTNIIARNVGMSLREGEDWARFADRYFLDMVDRARSDTDSFQRRVRKFLSDAHIPVQEKVQIDGKWDPRGEVITLEFPFGVRTRRGIDILAPVPLKPSSVHAFKASIDAIHRLDDRALFVALTSYDEDTIAEERLDHLLRPLEAGANSVNIDSENAVGTLHEILNH